MHLEVAQRSCCDHLLKEVFAFSISFRSRQHKVRCICCECLYLGFCFLWHSKSKRRDDQDRSFEKIWPLLEKLSCYKPSQRYSKNKDGQISPMLTMRNSSFCESPLIFDHHTADLASLAFTWTKPSSVKTVDMEALISKRFEHMTSIGEVISIARNIKDNGLGFPFWLHFVGCQVKLVVRVLVLHF